MCRVDYEIQVCDACKVWDRKILNNQTPSIPYNLDLCERKHQYGDLFCNTVDDILLIWWTTEINALSHNFKGMEAWDKRLNQSLPNVYISSLWVHFSWVCGQERLIVFLICVSKGSQSSKFSTIISLKHVYFSWL